MNNSTIFPELLQRVWSKAWLSYAVGRDGYLRSSRRQCIKQPSLWLVGYGDWTGYASATLIGVGRSARATVAELHAALHR